MPIESYEGAPRFIVPSERHVERLGQEGHVAETRASLRRRLMEELAPEIRPTGPEIVALVLEDGLRKNDDNWLLPLRAAGGNAWANAVDAVNDALGVLYAYRTGPATLDRIAALGGNAGRRAKLLADAMRGVEMKLSALHLVDERRVGTELASRISGSNPLDVENAARGRVLLADGIVDWDEADIVWWRALDHSLTRLGGSARITLPLFHKELDARRDRDPLETLFDELTVRLDEPPETSILETTLGNLQMTEGIDSLVVDHVEVRQAGSTVAEANAALDIIVHALHEGTPLDRIVVAMPQANERTLGALEYALRDAKIPSRNEYDAPLEKEGLVAFCLDAHRVAKKEISHRDLASLLRSRYVTAEKLTGREGQDARLLLGQFIRVLEEAPSCAGGNLIVSLEATVRKHKFRSSRERTFPIEQCAAFAKQVGELFMRVADAETRTEHISSTRDLWLGFGLTPRLSEAKFTLSRDKTPSTIEHNELHALGRDARGWEQLLQSLDAYEESLRLLEQSQIANEKSHRTRAEEFEKGVRSNPALAEGSIERRSIQSAFAIDGSTMPVSADTFRHELLRFFRAKTVGTNAGARTAALRTVRFSEIAQEHIDHLIVLDANDGVLPSNATHPPLLSEPLLAAIRELSPHEAPAQPNERHARELAALALAAVNAKHIVFVYKTTDSGNLPLLPAPLVTWLRRAGASFSNWSSVTPHPCPLTEREVRLAQLAVAGSERAYELAPTAARRAHHERLREAFHSRRQHAPSVGYLEDSAILRILTEETGGGERPFPVTGIEAVARCAFQGFAGHVLGARETRAHADLPDLREEGILVHEALAFVFEQTIDFWRKRPRDSEQILLEVERMLSHFLSTHELASGLRRLALERARQDVLKVVEVSIKDERWDFAYAEKPFGDGTETGWPALLLERGDSRLLLRGTIDRVDLAHDDLGARVVDYKRSARQRSTVGKDLGVTLFQIPFYAKVAARALARAHIAGVYFATGAHFLAKDSTLVPALEGLTSENEFSTAEQNAFEVIRRFREGAFAPIPKDNKFCSMCSFDGVCRRPRFVAEDEDSAV